MTRMLFATILSLLASGAHALPNASFGHEGGNGGDVMLCPKTSGTTIELLDYYLARELPPIREIDVGFGSLENRIDYVLDRLSLLDAQRAQRYKARFLQIWTDKVRWVGGFDFLDIPDTGHIPTKNCFPRQIAIQKKVQHPADEFLTLNADLWAQLPVRDQVGLILHELIYEEMLTLGQNDSVLVRQYNGLISSAGLAAVSQAEYDSLVAEYFSAPKPVNFVLDRFRVYVPVGLSVVEDLLTWVAPTKRALTWQLVGPQKDWLKLDQERGILKVSPKFGDQGVHRVDVHAASPQFSSSVPVLIYLLERGNYPPVWTLPGITQRLVSEEKATIDLRELALDLEEDQLTFVKEDGPEWIVVSPDGSVELKAPPVDSEVFKATISVSDDYYKSLMQIEVHVGDPGSCSSPE